MTKITACWAAALLVTVGSVSATAEERWITVDGVDAHPTQLLAKLNPATGNQRVQLNRLLSEHGLRVAKEYSLVAGLLKLELKTSPLTIQSLNRDYSSGESEDRRHVVITSALASLEESGLFEFVEPDYIFRTAAEPRDVSYQDGTLWGLRNRGDGTGVIGADIDARKAWDITTGSTEVVVGVIDSGIWYTHNDLKSQMWTNPGEIADNGKDDDENGWIDDVHGINAVVGSGDPLDDNGHGTHVSGVMGASANDSGEVVGVAWNVRLMALKASDSFGIFMASDIVQAIQYGVANGCHILNASLSGPGFTQAVFQALKAAGSQNVLVVAAAGNEGEDNDLKPAYPASYNLENIISVGAMNRIDQMATFSNYGLLSVDLAAPGQDIRSAWFGADDEYKLQDGTSQAAPHVTGVAALLLSVFPDMAVRELRERILSSVVKQPAYAGVVATGGRLNAFNVFDATPDGILEVAIDPPSQSAVVTDAEINLEVRVTDLRGITGATVEAIFPDGSIILLKDDGEGADEEADDANYSAQLIAPQEESTLTFQLRVSHPDNEGLEAVINYLVVAPPGNDNFASSFKLPPEGDSLVTSTAFATRQGPEPNHAGVLGADKSLWWTWTPDRDSVGFIDTSGSDFDTIIAVYVGNTLAAKDEDGIVPIASINNLGAKRDAFLSFPAERGVGYRIAISGVSESESGTLRLRVEPNGRPDLLAPVVAIDSPASGTITTGNRVEISGSAFDPEPNASGVNQVFLIVNEETVPRIAEGTETWSVTTTLNPGLNTIRAGVRDFSGNISLSDPLSVTFFIADPTNDHFANAEVLVGVEDLAGGLNAGATVEFGEPRHAGNNGGRSLWYRYTPTEDGELDLFTRGSNFDTIMGLYTGEKVTALNLVASNDDFQPGNGASRITHAVRAGVAYSIAVDGFSNQAGRVALRYTFTPGTVFDINLGAPEGGTVVPGSGSQTAGREVTYTAIPEPNFTFVGWEGDVTSGDNPLNLTVEGDLSFNAVFAPVAIVDNFESGGLSAQGYEFAGSQPWSIVEGMASAGTFSARSGAVGDNESSSLILRSVSPGGRGSFDYAVSSEEGWDFLEFWLNGEVKGRWSGRVPWQSFEFSVPSGEIELEWRYKKDFANSGGADAGFIDNIDFPMGSTAEGGAQLSVGGFGKAGLKLSIQGEADVDYVVEVSEDLEEWREFARGRADATGQLRFADAEAPSRTFRFFRVVKP